MVATVRLADTGYNLVDLSVYRQQIYNFLQTITLKYEPLIQAMGDWSQSLGFKDDPSDPHNQKYYLNIQGKYAPIDRSQIGGLTGYMRVISLDTQEWIDFTVESLENNPVTRSNYLPGTTYHTELCEKYPDYTDLIRGILFPVKDIDKAIGAENLTLLNYDASFLEKTEIDTIIAEINRSLAYIRRRWDFPIFGYEPYYHWVFYALVLQSLASTCFMARFRAIRKYGVHSFHVWSYLRSKGLDDYSDILSYAQSMFLYKNLDYLTENRGKDQTLKILAEKLLLPLDLALYGRDVIKQTLTGSFSQVGDDGTKVAPTHELVPEFIAKQVLDGYAPSDLTPPMDVLEMEEKLHSEGNEVADYSVPHEQDILTQVTTNTYPTKVLEINTISRNKRYVDLFNTFLADTLFYSIGKGYYDVRIEIPSKNGSALYVINAKEALLLLNYAICRAQNRTPTLIPTGWNCATALKPYPYELPESINYNTKIYRLSSYVDIPVYTQNLKPVYYFEKPMDVSNFVGTGFTSLVNQISLQRLTTYGPTSACMRYITDYMTVREMIPLDLAPYKTYKEYFSVRQDIFEHVIQVLEASSNVRNEFDTFANNLLNTLLPVTETFRYYGDFSISQETYKRIKNLFVQLTSYNINFINDTADRPRFFYLPHIEYYKSLRSSRDVSTGNYQDGDNSWGHFIDLGTPAVPSGPLYTGYGLLLVYHLEGQRKLSAGDQKLTFSLERSQGRSKRQRDIPVTDITYDHVKTDGIRCKQKCFHISNTITWSSHQ